MKTFLRQKFLRRRTERGAILAFTAISLGAFLLVAGLAVDVSHFYLLSTELQNAADAAALAGASALNSSSKGITEATNRAVAVMNKYEFNGADVTINRSDVRFAVNLSEFDNGGTGRSEATASSSPQNIRFVKVTIPNKTIGVFFAVSALGGDSFSLSRNAVAGQSVGVNKICNYNIIVLMEDDVDNNSLDVVNANCPDSDNYTAGCVYDIHLAPPCDPHASQYMVLDVPSERCDQWNERITAGAENCIQVGDTIATEPHITAPDIRRSVNTRFDTYAGGLTPADFPPDTNIKQNITYSQYKSGATSNTQSPSNAGLPDRRLLILPIARMSQWNPNTFTVQVAKFGVFFVQKKPSGSGNATADVRVEYIGDSVVVGDGSYNPGGPSATAQITVPVIYR